MKSLATLAGCCTMMLAVSAGCPPQQVPAQPDNYQCFKTCRNAGSVVIQNNSGVVSAFSQEEARTTFDAANPCPAEAASSQLSCEIVP